MNGLDDSVRGDDDEREGSVLRDEGLSKNPIRNRMSMDRLDIRSDDLTEMVARARDLFHSFISQTVRRRYKRPPIYLVDGWVTKALGFFTHDGVNAVAPGSSGTPSSTPTSTGGFGAVAALFAALNSFLAVVNGLSVLRVAELQDELRSGCLALLAERGAVDDVRASVKCLLREGRSLRALILTSPDLGPRLDEDFFERLERTALALLKSIEAFIHAPRPHLSGVSFDDSRFGGVLFDGIPELDIEGPAIVIAPSHILAWSDDVGEDLMRHHSDTSRMWLGARKPEQFRFAMALSNVVQHEMTHAMLRLANDAPPESDQAGSQWALYRRNPAIEEGIANFVAVLTMMTALLKSSGNLSGPKMIDFTSRKSGRVFDSLRPFIRWSYENYHAETTEAFLNAWEGNARNFKSFAGLLAMFATDHASIDWDAAVVRLAQGEVSTTRITRGPRP